MHQILWQVPGTGLKIYGFGLMLTLALLGSMNLAAWRARREALDGDRVYDLAVWVLVGGLVGARTFFVVEYWRSFHHWTEIFQIWNGGIVLYGSVIGGAIAFVLYRRVRPFPVRPMMDVVAPSLALGIALGRIGCFLNGCCYGDVCDLPWALSFPQPSAPWRNHVDHGLVALDAARSLPIHPTQLYSAIDGFVLLFLLTAYYPLRRRDGEVMALLMVTYPVSRFFIERLRNDESGIVGGFTISQAISVVILGLGLAYWAYLRRLTPGRYADGVRLTGSEVLPATRP